MQWTNFCRTAVYEEFDIQPIEEMGRYRQQKSLVDWRTARGPISKLLESNVYIRGIDSPRSMKRTWLNEAMEYTKKNGLVLTDKKSLRIQIRELFKDKDRLNLESKIGDIRETLAITSGKAILKEGLDPKRQNGSRLITRIRTGTLQNRLQLVGRGEISVDWKDKCLSSGQIAADNYRHWVFECAGLTTLREETIDSTIRLFRGIETTNWQNKLLSHMLGGKLTNSSPKPVLQKEKRRIDSFHERLSIIRTIKIKKAKNE